MRAGAYASVLSKTHRGVPLSVDAVSITVARLLSAVQDGSIDPKTVRCQYDVAPRRLDVGRALRSARARGAGAVLREVSPQFGLDPVMRTSA